ncbi:MAG: acetyl-CoA carboxylase biotin carboxyl carrier protein subunit [Bacteroidetes bacterium]|nr:acetyl-CoA carboxylase biotin carboxyl carrier protein subunit [Bacteroidota bacterium]
MPEAVQQLDVVKENDNQMHVLCNGHSFQAEFVSANHSNKTYVFKIAGNLYQVKVEDHYDRLIQSLGLTVHSSTKINAVKAPMPGMVLDVLVQEAQEIHKGDPLLILEAMKMENVLKAAGDGKVKAIKVSKGAAVDKNQLLIEME